jgi:hypothetical protein
MFILILDKVMREFFYPFKPFFNLLSFSKPYEFSKAASWTDPIVASTSEWIHQGRRRAEQEER